MKTFIIALILLFAYPVYSAPTFTTTYSLETPSEGSRDWRSIFSADMISIDEVLTIISNDINVITDDATVTVGGIVGRFKFISDDGNACYIPVYAPN